MSAHLTLFAWRRQGSLPLECSGRGLSHTVRRGTLCQRFKHQPRWRRADRFQDFHGPQGTQQFGIGRGAADPPEKHLGG